MCQPDDEVLKQIFKIEKSTDQRKIFPEINAKNAAFWKRHQELYESIHDQSPELQYQAVSRLMEQAKAPIIVNNPEPPKPEVETPIAEVGVPKPAKHRERRKNKELIKRRDTIQRADLVSQNMDEYCKNIDAAKLERPDRWKALGFPATYLEAWNYPNPVKRAELQKLIRDEKRNNLEAKRRA